MLAQPRTRVQILTSLPSIQISHFTDLNVLYVDWISFQTTESIMHGCELILQYLRQTGCTRLLNDNTHVQGPWDGAVNWLVSEWFPLAKNAGLVRLAWILSPSLFSKLSAQKTVGLLPVTQHASVHLFNNFDEAYRWLHGS